MTGGLALDALLVALSDAHDALRASAGTLEAAQAQQEAAAQWVAPDEFKRWVRACGGMVAGRGGSVCLCVWGGERAGLVGWVVKPLASRAHQAAHAPHGPQHRQTQNASDVTQ